MCHQSARGLSGLSTLYALREHGREGLEVVGVVVEDRAGDRAVRSSQQAPPHEVDDDLVHRPAAHGVAGLSAWLDDGPALRDVRRSALRLRILVVAAAVGGARAACHVARRRRRRPGWRRGCRCRRGDGEEEQGEQTTLEDLGVGAPRRAVALCVEQVERRGVGAPALGSHRCAGRDPCSGGRVESAWTASAHNAPCEGSFSSIARKSAMRWGPRRAGRPRRRAPPRARRHRARARRIRALVVSATPSRVASSSRGGERGEQAGEVSARRARLGREPEILRRRADGHHAVAELEADVAQLAEQGGPASRRTRAPSRALAGR